MHEFCTCMYFSKTVNTQTVSFIHIPRYIFLSIFQDSQFHPYSQIYILIYIPRQLVSSILIEIYSYQFHPYSQIFILIHIPRKLVSSIFLDIYSHPYTQIFILIHIPRQLVSSIFLDKYFHTYSLVYIFLIISDTFIRIHYSSYIIYFYLKSIS